ncbi:hypothetical protein MLD38_013466 [Melastoma candidum]|uniref:Uncharacterized protein n=1 Tax=Melastoma candidum TaxID=119954 RepID=A0ACB9R929_9MYRT|nr:hypothetical protein MLD38_013466 [Melastoma candidum]
MFFLFLVLARSDPNVTLVAKACTGGEYENTKYGVSVGYVLEDLRRSTPEQGFEYDCEHEYLGVWSRGHGACFKGLSKEDCGRCMVKAKGLVLQVCANKIHGDVRLQDCRIMYDKMSRA